MVDFLVALPCDLDAVLIDGVVVGSADFERIPRITAGHLTRQPDALGLLAISLLLLPILQAEQLPLHLQLPYPRHITHNLNRLCRPYGAN